MEVFSEKQKKPRNFSRSFLLMYKYTLYMFPFYDSIISYSFCVLNRSLSRDGNMTGFDVINHWTACILAGKTGKGNRKTFCLS